MNFAIFASGAGTNAEAILRYFKGNECNRPVLILTDNPTAGVIDVAHRWEIPCIILQKEEYRDGRKLFSLIAGAKAEFVVLAGYLRLVPAELIQLAKGKIINLHPALLPDFGGKGMYGARVHEAVKSERRSETGITIHWVNEKYDEGAIIAQYKVAVSTHDSASDIAQKVRELEHRYYPEVIEKLLDKS